MPSYPSPVTPLVPAAVRERAKAAGAVSWLDALPALVAGLEHDWSVTVGRPYEGSTEAFVAQARLSDGTPAVLKLMIPRPGDHRWAARCSPLRTT
jgi:streptomycin 6-kinase